MKFLLIGNTAKAAKEFAETLKRILDQRHIDRKWFAWKAEIDYNQLNDYLRGRHFPSYITLEKFAKTLNVTIEDLLVDISSESRFAADGSVLDYQTTKHVAQMATTQRKGENPKPETPQPRLKDLTKAFSKRMVNFYRYFTEQVEPKEDYLSRKAMESATEIGSILLKSDYTGGKEAYYQSASQALDRARDTEYWIDLLYSSNYINEQEAASLLEDLRVITSILWAMTSKHRQGASDTAIYQASVSTASPNTSVDAPSEHPF